MTDARPSGLVGVSWIAGLRGMLATHRSSSSEQQTYTPWHRGEGQADEPMYAVSYEFSLSREVVQEACRVAAKFFGDCGFGRRSTEQHGAAGWYLHVIADKYPNDATKTLMRTGSRGLRTWTGTARAVIDERGQFFIDLRRSAIWPVDSIVRREQMAILPNVFADDGVRPYRVAARLHDCTTKVHETSRRIRGRASRSQTRCHGSPRDDCVLSTRRWVTRRAIVRGLLSEPSTTGSRSSRPSVSLGHQASRLKPDLRSRQWRR